jgi:hypothetical protein
MRDRVGASFAESMTRLGRLHLFGALTVLALVLIVADLIGLILTWLPTTTPESTADRLALIGVFLAGATCALAAVAAIVALVAYEVSVRVPTIGVSVVMAWADDDKPTVALAPLPPTDVNFVGFVRRDGDSMVTIRLRNTSTVTARNVAVRLNMRGLLGWQTWVGQDPALVPAAEGGGIHELQWEGGADYAIHGEQTRDIRVEIGEMRVLRNSSVSLELDVFADGVHVKKSVPVTLLPAEQYDAQRSEQQDEILAELAQEEVAHE